MEASMKKLLPGRPHRRSGLLKHQLQLVRNQSGRYEIGPVPDPLSFDKGFFLFIRACQLLTQQMEAATIVAGVAGPSGAGKTVFTEKVSNFMPGIAVICMDNYNVASRVIDGNYDDPRIVDFDTLLHDINNLRQGKAADVPIYDFKLSRRVGYRRVEPPVSRIVIVEGIYALNEKLRPLLDLRVSITGGVHFDLVKRVLRDINRSGQDPQEIIHQISETVYPMYKAFIEPDLETAHIKIANKFNPFSGLQSPTYLLKSSRSVTEEQIKGIFPSQVSETTEETYDIYLMPPGEDPETCQSYLRMRNRDGKYSLIFEELVTDGDFLISPRITFDVSVRVLGGLMALGYEMATILKRSSRVFSDDKLLVKIDKLEQLHRKYVQIQGKDRSLVAQAGTKLGLDGSYIPRSYIEQIQLEKLTAEVMALPEDLKSKLGAVVVPSSPLSSPVMRSYSRSFQKEASPTIPCFASSLQPQAKVWDNNRSPAAGQGLDRIMEQLASVNDKLDELVTRLVDFEKRLPTSSPALTSNDRGQISPSSQPLSDEVQSLARAQLQMNTHLDVLSNIVREKHRLQNRSSTTGPLVVAASAAFLCLIAVVIRFGKQKKA